MRPPSSVLSISHFLFSLLFLSLSVSSSPRDGETQKLIAFKSSLSDPNLLRNWLPDRNPCSFSGVTCRENSVSSVNLDFVPLRTDFRHVADFLMSLVHLETLSLSSTNTSGSIALSECGRSLTSLDLSFNGLSGSLSSLSNLGSCSKLKILNLSGNFLEFSGKVSGGFKLTGLETLDLSYNQISGKNAAAWVLSGGCRDLKVLSLRGNEISGDFDVSSCINLRFLDLSSNNFSLAVPPLGECGSLEHLYLSENKFSGDISVAISSCKELKFLNISNNQFSGPVPVIPGKSIKLLSLADNHFHGEIPPSMADTCPTLVHLDLSSNNLSGNIPASLSFCSSLEVLNISSNKFGGEFPVGGISKMSKLKQLILSFNEFTGFLPESLSDFTGLEMLDLSSNNFSGKIPTGLCQNPRNSLRELYLQSNQLTGSIPSSLSNCTNLVSLHLGLNYLTGSIPSSLRYLSKLKDLKLWLNSLQGEIPQELMYMQTLETLILDFNELTGEIPSGLSNCTSLNWLSLSNNRLSGEIPSWIGRLSNLAILKLSNNSFTGRIPPELGDCSSLIWLDLSTNFLNGSIPPALFKQSGKIAVNFIAGKRFVYIKNDGSKQCHGAGNLLEFQGIRPEQLTRISTRNPCSFTASTRLYGGHAQPTQPPFDNNGSMIFLDVSYNTLSGTIPKEIGTMPYLFILNLGHNSISGSIPDEIGDLRGLNILDLSTNRLEGMIPQSMTALTMLMEIDLSNNYLTGQIPEMGQLETFPPSRFLNNSGLCGYPLPRCADASGEKIDSRHQKSHVRHASLLGSIAMGVLLSLFCMFGFIVLFIETKKRKNEKVSGLESRQGHSNSNSGTANTSWKLTGAREALSINLAAFDKPLRKLTFADLLEATNGFHNDCLIGSGGFGDVYKAKLKDGSIVAIKKLIHVSGQGDREFTAEMETIGKIKHRNLVPLLGYCKVKEERLLVYEYMKHGSLEDVLHNRKNPRLRLNWSARRKIAVGAARGLAFLHHNCTPHIIHRDMKSSNVLVDENLNARVSDFGMARLMSAMDTHLSVSTLAGTPGYVPPEYYQSFRCSTKGDVYSYGVVLLELLTGKRPTDSSDFGDNNNLVGWVKQYAKLRISDVFDQELLKDDPGLELELLQHLRVACACLDDRPLRRPTMIQVMAMFKEIQAGGATEKEMETETTQTPPEDGGFSSSVGFGSVEMEAISMKEIPEISKDNT